MSIKSFIKNDTVIRYSLRILAIIFVLIALCWFSFYIRKTVILHRLMSDTVSAYDNYLSEDVPF